MKTNSRTEDGSSENPSWCTIMRSAPKFKGRETKILKGTDISSCSRAPPCRLYRLSRRAHKSSNTLIVYLPDNLRVRGTLENISTTIRCSLLARADWWRAEWWPFKVPALTRSDRSSSNLRSRLEKCIGLECRIFGFFQRFTYDCTVTPSTTQTV